MKMRAIQIRYLPATDKRPARLKAFTKHYQFTVNVHELSTLELQAVDLANSFIKKQEWRKVTMTGFGQIPNSDWVATLMETK